MLNYKNINLKLFSLTLLTTIGCYGVNEALAKKTNVKDNNVVFLQALGESPNFDGKVIASGIGSDLSSNSQKDEQWLLVSQESRGDSAIDLNNFGGFSHNAGGQKTKAIRTVSLFLFLLFFVPLGIFYPFFSILQKAFKC